MNIMRVRWLAVVLLAAGSLSGWAAEPARPSYMIVALGDSLTESKQVAANLRWTSLLQDMLRKKHPELEITVFNAGVGGNTSREMLARLEKDVLSRRPNLVILEAGANDATSDQKRHVELDEFAKNVVTISKRIADRTGAKMICWPCTPIIDAKHKSGRNPYYASAGGIDGFQTKYREKLAETSRQLNAPFVDMDAIFRGKIKEKGEDLYICQDGIHYREAGNQLVAEGLAPEVEKIIQNSK